MQRSISFYINLNKCIISAYNSKKIFNYTPATYFTCKNKNIIPNNKIKESITVYDTSNNLSTCNLIKYSLDKNAYKFTGIYLTTIVAVIGLDTHAWY